MRMEISTCPFVLHICWTKQDVGFTFSHEIPIAIGNFK